jgi:archaeal flagellar protein FlaJ
MSEKNPTLMLFPINKAKSFGDGWLSIGRILSKLVFSLKYDLERAEINIDVERYCLAALMSAIVYSIIFSMIGLVFGVVITKYISELTIWVMIGFGIMGFILMLTYHLFYPSIAVHQIALFVDQQLLFALRSMLLQLSSGMSLFETINTVSKSGFGQVSKELEIVIKDINSGLSETQALEKLAFRTESEYLKKTVWQILTTMKSGGSIVGAINVQIDTLIDYQMTTIKNYSAELNLWILIYLIVAAAMPSLGVTFLTILSTIGGSGIGKEIIITIILLSILVQAGMITFLRTRVPRVIK